VLLCTAASAYLAFRHPPYQTDESSHVGYVLTIREGALPSLDTPVPAAEGRPMLETVVGLPWPFAVSNIHTAINPPYAYAAAAVPAAITDAADVRGGSLLGVRLFNVACTGAAVYVVYRFGRELTGRLDAALLSAALVGTLITVPQLGSLAHLEGPALFATTGVAWWLARFVRTRALVDATALGLWCALAAGIRTMSTAYAVVAALLALAVGLVGSRRHRIVQLLVRLGAPSLVAVGWFYGLNLVRYGEPTGSEAVYDDRIVQRGFVEFLFSRDSLAVPLDYLLLEVSSRRGWWEVSHLRQWIVLALTSVVLVAAVAVVARRRVGGGDDQVAERVEPPGACVGSWLALIALSAAPVLLVTYHLSNGGAGHPRYLGPLLPVIAVSVALLVAELWRWAPVFVAAASIAALALRLEDAASVHEQLVIPGLEGPLVGPALQRVALASAVVGGLVLLGAFVALTARRPTGAPVVASRSTVRRTSVTPT